MAQLVCSVCGVVKELLPSQLRQRTGLFCSQKCRGKATSKRTARTCSQCGKGFVRRRDQPGYFCSPECSYKSRKESFSVWGKTFDADARRKYFRDYFAANREKIKAASRAWARNNRAQRNRLQNMRRAGGVISRDQWLELVSVGKCAFCGSSSNLQVDHIIPIARGGTSVPENLQVLCAQCNQSKGAREKPMFAIHGIKITET